MSVNTEHVWLTRDAYDRVKRELAALLNQRESRAADVAAQEQRELRIRQLQELIRRAAVHEPPVPDGASARRRGCAAATPAAGLRAPRCGR
jgi:transcription elongation GreA/GreB family factor